jgi:hypothetical protein
MQAAGSTGGAGKLFTWGLLALLVVAMVLFVGTAWLKSCKQTEGYTYMASMARSIDPAQSQEVMKSVEVDIRAPPSEPIGEEQMNRMADALKEMEPKPAEDSGAKAMEKFRNLGGPIFEGFAGPVAGTGMPDCVRSSKEGAALYELLSGKVSTTEEGGDDLRELQLILGKLACFKRDLTGAASVVAATRTQPFSTAHDIEPIAETTARCFAKTIPQRDLSLSFDKWGSRGTFLIKRLCTSLRLSGAEEDEAERLFGALMADVSDIAMGRCCNAAGDAVLAGQVQPRMVAGYEAPGLNDLRKYEGYY